MDSVILSPFAVPLAAPMPAPSGTGAAIPFATVMAMDGASALALAAPSAAPAMSTLTGMLTSSASLDTALAMASSPAGVPAVGVPAPAPAITAPAPPMSVPIDPQAATAAAVPVADVPDAPGQPIATEEPVVSDPVAPSTPDAGARDVSVMTPPKDRSERRPLSRAQPLPQPVSPIAARGGDPVAEAPDVDTPLAAPDAGDAASSMRTMPDDADPVGTTQAPVPTPPPPTPAPPPAPAPAPTERGTVIVEAAPAISIEAGATDPARQPAPERTARRSKTSAPTESGEHSEGPTPFNATATPALSPATAPAIVPAVNAVADRPTTPDDAASPSPVKAVTARLPDAPPGPAVAAEAPTAQPATAPAFTPTATGVAPAHPARPATPVEPTVVAAQPGRIGHETGVAIARHAAQGIDTVSIRLSPGDMGWIEVRLSFEEGGAMRAVVAADNPASLDLLRRDSPQLIRALSDAGIATDAGSFRFDTRSDDRGGGGSAWQRPQPASPYARDEGPEEQPVTPEPYRRLTTRGRVEIMA